MNAEQNWRMGTTTRRSAGVARAGVRIESLRAALVATWLAWLGGFMGLGGLVGLVGCAGDGVADDPAAPSEDGSPGTVDAVDFARDVQPIFDANCSCHLSFSAPQGMVLQEGASYNSLVGVPSTANSSFLRVVPGDPDASYLLVTIDDDAERVDERVGDRMPRGLPPLSGDDVATIRRWIDEGATRVALPGDGGTGDGNGDGDSRPPVFDGVVDVVPVSSQAVDVFWNSAQDDETPPESIVLRVFIATQSGAQDFSRPVAVALGSSSSVRIEGLEPSTRYFVVVRAEDAAGNQDGNTVEMAVTTFDATSSGRVDFAAQIQPIFHRSCSCHLTLSAPKGAVLLAGLSYDALVGTRSSEVSSLFRVEPLEPDRSYLVIKIDDASSGVHLRAGERMPYQLPPLSRADTRPRPSLDRRGSREDVRPPAGRRQHAARVRGSRERQGDESAVDLCLLGAGNRRCHAGRGAGVLGLRRGERGRVRLRRRNCVTAVVVVGGADPWGPKAVRASAGSVLRVPIVAADDIAEVLAALRTSGATVVATDVREGEPHDTGALVPPVAVVLGSEPHGLDRSIDPLVDHWVRIAMRGPTESLNVAMAGTLLAYEASRPADSSG